MTKKQINSKLNTLSTRYFQNQVITVDSVDITKKRLGDYSVALRVHVPREQDLQTVGLIHARLQHFMGGIDLFFKVHEQNVQIDYTQSVDRERINITLCFNIAPQWIS